MSLFFPHSRDPDGRAARLAVGVALMLAVGVGAWVLLGTRLGSRGRGGDGPPSTRRAGGADAGAATAPAGPAASEGEPRDAGARPRQPAAGLGDAGPAGGSGAGLGAGRGASGQDLLAVWDHVERQIAAAMARARESVVALEYTAGDSSAGRRRVASGVVISHLGEILSVRIDPPAGGGAVGSRAADKKGQEGAPIVALDYRGRRHAALWVAADPHTGLTLLRVSARAVRPIRTAADGPKLGCRVFVVGNPFGMGHSVSPGHVAGLDRALELGTRQLGGLIQVQAPLYPGDSGAAVVDVRGDWLGLIRGGLAIPERMGTRPSPSTDPGAAPGPSARAPRAEDDPAAAARGTAARGTAKAGDDVATVPPAEQETDFGFAIPTRDALWIADQLRAHGRVDRAYLGVSLETAPVSAVPIAPAQPTPSPVAVSSSAPAPAAAGAWRGSGGAARPSDTTSEPTSAAAASPADLDGPALPGEGARLRDVVPDTPAARAGLRPGDRIIVVDGQPIRSGNDLIDRLDRTPARATIVVGVVREGDPSRPRFDVSVRTSIWPGQPAPGPASSRATASEPRPPRASVSVTPTASRVAPAGSNPSPPPSSGSNPSPPPSSGSNPSPPPSGGDHPGPAPAVAPSSTPRQDPTPPRVPAAPDRPEPVSPAPASSPSLNELRLTLPRAVVERIEHLERRIDELEHVRGAAAREPDPKAPPDRTNAPAGGRP